MQVCARLERIREGETRNGRAWLGGPAHGKTELQRVAALLMALLQPYAVVGYCEYNKCQLSPLDILTIVDPPLAPSSPPHDLAALLRKKRYIVFFADEVEHLYFRRDKTALYQVCLLPISTITGSSLCDFVVAADQRFGRRGTCSQHGVGEHGCLADADQRQRG